MVYFEMTGLSDRQRVEMADAIATLHDAELAEAARPWREIAGDVLFALESNPNLDHHRDEAANCRMAKYVALHGLEHEVKHELACCRIALFQAETRVARAHIQTRIRALLAGKE